MASREPYGESRQTFEEGTRQGVVTQHTPLGDRRGFADHGGGGVGLVLDGAVAGEGEGGLAGGGLAVEGALGGAVAGEGALAGGGGGAGSVHGVGGGGGVGTSLYE
jgi:hypothetical protein